MSVQNTKASTAMALYSVFTFCAIFTTTGKYIQEIAAKRILCARLKGIEIIVAIGTDVAELQGELYTKAEHVRFSKGLV